MDIKMSSTTHASKYGSPINKGSDGFSDIRKIAKLILSHWYLFVISFVLCLFAVWLYHRYTLPVYRASVTMLFKVDAERDFSRSVITEGFGLSAEMKSIENQSFIIRSHAMALRAVNRLDFGLSYYSKGRVKDSEIYHPLPFIIDFDSIHPQILNTPIELTFQSDGRVQVSVSSEGAPLHNFSESSDMGFSKAFNFKKVFAQGERVQSPAFNFTIQPSESGAWPASGEYYVRFNSHSSVATRYRSSLSVSPYSEGSSIIFISATGLQPRKLARFVQVLSEEIVENNLERKNDMANRSIDFIQHQLSVVSDTLLIIQQKLINFRRANKFMMPADVSQKLSNEFFEMEKERRMLDFQYDYLALIQKRLRAKTLDENDFLLPAFSDNKSALLQQFITDHLLLLKEYALIKGESGSKNPYQYELEKKIELSASSLLTGIGKQMENIELNRQEMERHKNLLTSRISGMPELERDYLALERTHKLNDAIYTFLLQKASENQIAKASNTPDNEVLDQATVYGPISPNKRNNYSKGLLVAFLLPALIIGLKEFLNTRIRSKDDLSSLKIKAPLLGTILHNVDNHERVVLDQQNTFIGESFRSLRARLRFMMVQPTAKVITLTSTNTGEGKTFCSVNLASVFALSGKKTVLVGFDLRKPRISPIFNIKEKMGISNYLIGQAKLEEIIFETSYDNLWLIPGGDIPPNPSELISTDATVYFFQQIRERFDIVIVDTPPVGLVSDARILMEMADCNLYIVRAGVTVKEHFELTINNLLDQEVGCLGLILNDVTTAPKGYGYYASGYFSEANK